MIKPPSNQLLDMHLNMRSDETVMSTVYCRSHPLNSTFTVYVTSVQLRAWRKTCDEPLCVCTMSPYMSSVNGTRIYSPVFGS